MSASVLTSAYEDLDGKEEITTVKEITDALGDTIVLDRYKHEIEWLRHKILDVAKLCWSNKDENGTPLERTLIKIKNRSEDDTEYVLPLKRLMYSMCFISRIAPYLDQIPQDKLSDFLLESFLSEKLMYKMTNNVTNILHSNGLTLKEIQYNVAELAYHLQLTTNIFSAAESMIITAENIFLDHYKTSPLIREINNTEYPSTMQTHEIVQSNAEKYKQLEKEMIRLNNPLFTANKFTSIIKPKQMEEQYINFSQIPDGESIVPIIMNGNGFHAGYNKLDTLFAGAIAARVPDIMNKEYMGPAGYFGRNLMITTYGTLSQTVWDCGSRNPIQITLDEESLSMFRGSNYYQQKNDGRLRVLSEDDTHLIGQTLYFRNPCTCNLNQDVCHVCYGTYGLEVGSLFSGNIYTTQLMSSRVGQNILSAKHLIKTNAEPINFSKGYDSFLVLESSILIPNQEDDKKFDIFIPVNFLDDLANEEDPHFKFYVGPKAKKEIKVTNFQDIHVPESVIDQATEVVIEDVSYYKINSNKVLSLGNGLCEITPINIMMTAKYMDIMKLLETMIGNYTDLSSVMDMFVHMLHGTIPILATHAGVIIGSMVRAADNKILRPNWLQEDVEYQLLTVKNATYNSESATTALSFERTKNHLKSDIFDNRNKINRVGVTSFSDMLFGNDATQI
jgi:hypothetical protein